MRGGPRRPGSDPGPPGGERTPFARRRVLFFSIPSRLSLNAGGSTRLFSNPLPPLFVRERIPIHDQARRGCPGDYMVNRPFDPGTVERRTSPTPLPPGPRSSLFACRPVANARGDYSHSSVAGSIPAACHPARLAQWQSNENVSPTVRRHGRALQPLPHSSCLPSGFHEFLIIPPFNLP